MSSVVSKWVVLQHHAVAAGDRDAVGVLRDDVVARWIDDARGAYLECCPVLRETSERTGCALRYEVDELPSGRLFGAATTVNVSAGATEVFPTSFTLAFRLRGFGSDDDTACNVTCAVSLQDPATGVPHELGDAVRDELIALAHAARHFN